MKYLLIFLSLFQSNVFTQDRLPGFPTDSQIRIPEQSLVYPKVKRIIYLESSFTIDSLNVKLKYDISYDKNRIKTVKFINTKNDSAYLTQIFDEISRIINQDRFKERAIEKTTYFYDEKKLKSTEIQFDRNLSVSKRTEILYDRQYHPIKKLEFGNDSIPRCNWTYKYNSYGDLVEETFINVPQKTLSKTPANPDYTTTYSISYDSLKRPLSKTEYLNSRKRIRTEYFYSNDSSSITTISYLNYSVGLRPRWIETSINHDSVRIYKHQSLIIPDTTKIQSENISLFINNDLAESSQWSSNYSKKSFYKTITQYDSHNNWTKKTTSEKGRITKVLERKITY